MTEHDLRFYELLIAIGSLSDDLIEIQIKAHELHQQLANWKKEVKNEDDTSRILESYF